MGQKTLVLYKFFHNLTNLFQIMWEIVLALVGNKVDLLDQEKVSYDDAANYAKVLENIRNKSLFVS